MSPELKTLGAILLFAFGMFAYVVIIGETADPESRFRQWLRRVMS